MPQPPLPTWVSPGMTGQKMDDARRSMLALCACRSPQMSQVQATLVRLPSPVSARGSALIPSTTAVRSSLPLLKPGISLGAYGAQAPLHSVMEGKQRAYMRWCWLSLSSVSRPFITGDHPLQACHQRKATVHQCGGGSKGKAKGKGKCASVEFPLEALGPYGLDEAQLSHL